MNQQKQRISIPKEDRIWNLRCQGYDFDSIARIVNVSKGTPSRVIRRVRRRPPLTKDPIRRGRGHSFLSDSQIVEIRQRFRAGEKQMSIAKDFCIEVCSVSKICNYKTYQNPCFDETTSGYQFNFANRLVAG